MFCFIGKCVACGQTNTNTISAFGKYWHSNCFYCSKCSKFLTPGLAFQINQQLYCRECTPDQNSEELEVSENEILGRLVPEDSKWNLSNSKKRNRD